MPSPDVIVCSCGVTLYKPSSHNHKCDAQKRVSEALERMLTPVKTLDLHEQYAANWDAVFGERDDG